MAGSPPSSQSAVSVVSDTLNFSLLLARKISAGIALGSLLSIAVNPAHAASEIANRYSFNGTAGVRPYAGLTLGPGGLFYGATWGFSGHGAFVGENAMNAPNSLGTIFSYNPRTNAVSNLYGFGDVVSPWGPHSPMATMTIGVDGKLYGTTTGMGAPAGMPSIFSFDITTNGLAIRATIPQSEYASCGYPPCYSYSQTRSSLTQASNGIFYGTTIGGGVNGKGSVFSFNPSTDSFSTIYSFSDGYAGYGYVSPNGRLAVGPNGLLYGTTGQGGVNSRGSIFSLDTETNEVSTLYSFSNGAGYSDIPGWNADGAGPRAGLTLGADGIFYGSTHDGGLYDGGTIFSFDINSDTLSSLYSLDMPSSGRERGWRYSIAAEMTLGLDGLLYGTHTGSGEEGFGGIFTFNPVSNSLTFLDSFMGPDGSQPFSGLALGIDGIFYGTTSGDGFCERCSGLPTTQEGTIFSFDPGFSSAGGGGGSGGTGDSVGGSTGGGGSGGSDTGGTSTASVPGPLPLLGLGAAFAWSRRLRNKYRNAAQAGARHH
jgi:uncharacterized repeat protein (TIGR03803 family)